MNCPVCKRELAPTLSICLTCGAMMNDTVREELETKIGRPAISTPRPDATKFEPIKPWSPEPVKISSPDAAVVEAEPLAMSAPPPMAPIVPAPVKTEIVVEAAAPQAPLIEKPVAPKPRPITAPLTRKETSPTLVDFQPVNPTIPDWRLQLQNSIRKRTAGSESVAVPAPAATAVAVAPAPVQREIRPQIPSPAIQNEKLANAMKRIEASKRAYGSAAAVAVAKAKMKKPAVPNRAFPFNVVEKAPAPTTTPSTQMPPVGQEPTKPKLVSPLRIEKKKFDTNKLPPIPEPETPLPIEIADEPEAATEIRTQVSFDRMSIRNAPEPLVEEEIEKEEFEEIDDLAPLSMRFGSAVFDLIIGGFAAGIVLTPFLVSNTNIATVAGGLAIIGAVVFVMFLYLTISIAFAGRTIGMKLFSIEIIDAEANELPTLHQAAVHSAVYLLSLLLFGIGFLPAFFNEERRAMHDLLSGTLLIREY